MLRVQFIQNHLQFAFFSTSFQVDSCVGYWAWLYRRWQLHRYKFYDFRRPIWNTSIYSSWNQAWRANFMFVKNWKYPCMKKFKLYYPYISGIEDTNLLWSWFKRRWKSVESTTLQYILERYSRLIILTYFYQGSLPEGQRTEVFSFLFI